MLVLQTVTSAAPPEGLRLATGCPLVTGLSSAHLEYWRHVACGMPEI